MATVHIRYLVDHVEAAIRFYTTHLGFSLLSSAAPAFADVTRGDLRLLLSGPRSSAGRPMPDGRRPSPGGGTEFISSSKTSPRRSRASARLVCGSAATLSLDLVRSVRCSGQCVGPAHHCLCAAEAWRTRRGGQLLCESETGARNGST